jgi:hypothetical protein
MQTPENPKWGPFAASGWKSWFPVFLFGGLALLVVGARQLAFSPAEVSPQPGVSMELPAYLLGMPGQEQEVSEGERVILPADTEFAKKNYTDSFGNLINCQIVLSGADRRSIHRPEICLPAQGWTQKSGRPLDVELEDGSSIRVMMLDLVREIDFEGERRALDMIFLYWFVGNDLVTHDHLNRILRTNFDLLLHNRVHRWAYIIVSAPVLRGFTPGGLDQKETLDLLKQAVRELVPRIHLSATSVPAEA